MDKNGQQQSDGEVERTSRPVMEEQIERELLSESYMYILELIVYNYNKNETN